MNPEFLRVLWSFFVTGACYVSCLMDLTSPDFDLMPPTDVDVAIAVYDEMIRIDPSNPDGYAKRGCALLAKRQFDKAIKDFDTLILLEPDSPRGYTHRANAWMKQNCLERALADCDEAIRLDADHAHPFRNRGQVLHHQKKTGSGRGGLQRSNPTRS